MENTANLAYDAQPDRICIVDSEGLISYISGPGPKGFDVEALADWLARTHPEA